MLKMLKKKIKKRKRKKDSEKKIKKNIYYEIQKKNEIELTPVNKRNKNEDLNIIKDDNIEIHGKRRIKKIRDRKKSESINESAFT